MSSAAPYYSRAPRYVFRPEDRTFVRYAEMETRGITTNAIARDLSSTGLSFILGEGEAPIVGEQLKIEFTTPDKKQMAWFATVVRVEERFGWDPDLGDHASTLVALQFKALPEPYQAAIQKSINQDSADENIVNAFDAATRPTLELCGLAALLFVAMALICLPVDKWMLLVRF